MAEAEERDELSLTFAEAVRPPQKGELEQLISSELALAVFSTDPLQKIRHVLEAYNLLHPEQRRELFTEQERDEYGRLYEVCISLINTVELPSPNGGRLASVAWSFTVQDAPLYLNWIKRVWTFNIQGFGELLKRLNSGDEEVKRQAWIEYLQFIFDYTACACNLSFIQQLKSEFIVYCMPKISRIMRVIFTSVVSAETWSETLLLMRGGARRQVQP